MSCSANPYLISVYNEIICLVSYQDCYINLEMMTWIIYFYVMGVRDYIDVVH